MPHPAQPSRAPAAPRRRRRSSGPQGRSLVLVLALAFPMFAVAGPERTVRMLNWSDYVEPRVLDDFTRASGIRVMLDTYDSMATMQEKVAAADPPYDVVVTPSAQFATDLQAGKYQSLDYDRLPNAAGLMRRIQEQLAVLDRGNRHGVDYMWYATGIAYSGEEASDRLGADDPTSMLQSWNSVFKPELVKKFAECGVQIIDEPDILFPIALDYLNIGPDPRSDADIARASDLWARLRAVTKLFSTPDAIASLADGNVCLAVVPADFAMQSRQRANRAKNDVDVKFVVPREGAPLTLDVLAIPTAAPDIDAAHKLIDFLLRPDVAARNSNMTRLANSVTASKPLLDPSLASDPGIYPDDDTMGKLFVAKPYDGRQRKLVERYWIKSKTGKLGS